MPACPPPISQAPSNHPLLLGHKEGETRRRGGLPGKPIPILGAESLQTADMTMHSTRSMQIVSRMEGKTPKGRTQCKTWQGEGLGQLPSSVTQSRLEIATFTLV